MSMSIPAQLLKMWRTYDRFQNDGAVNMQMMMQEQKAKPNDTTNNSQKILQSTDGSAWLYLRPNSLENLQW